MSEGESEGGVVPVEGEGDREGMRLVPLASDGHRPPLQDHVKVARVRCLDQVKARGFTFARGKVVEGVPLAHAEYLAAGGKAEILEVS